MKVFKEKKENNMTSGAKNVSIFCRTYDKDAKWFERALPTWLEKAHGYNSFTVSGIEEQCQKIMEICHEYGVVFVPDNESAEIADGYINQQYTKLTADELNTESDYILFVDADTLCLEEHDASTWFRKGKPILLHTPWSEVGDAFCWHKPTWDALGYMPTYEFMRRLPLLYPKCVLISCREHIEKLHGMSLMDYLKKQSAFSEFNVIGSYAHRYYADTFHWIDTMKDELPSNPFKQYWSHGGLKAQVDEGKVY